MLRRLLMFGGKIFFLNRDALKIINPVSPTVLNRELSVSYNISVSVFERTAEKVRMSMGFVKNVSRLNSLNKPGSYRDSCTCTNVNITNLKPCEFSGFVLSKT